MAKKRQAWNDTPPAHRPIEDQVAGTSVFNPSGSGTDFSAA